MKTLRNRYDLKFRVLSIEEDAVYIYSPGKEDLVIIHKGFRDDNRLITQFIDYLGDELELRKRINKSGGPIVVSCTIGDLDLDREPDFIVDNEDGYDLVDLPGDEVVLIGKAVPRKPRVAQPVPARSVEKEFIMDYSHLEGVVDPAIIALFKADDLRRRNEHDDYWDIDELANNA